jgi:outer membrane protein assembly factor BamB
MQRANDRKQAAWALGLLLAMIVPPARADDWPQWLGPKRDGVWREKGILDKFPPGGPKVLWRTPVGGGYAGPAVAGGKVYLMDRQLAKGVKNPDDPFSRPRLEGSERVLCLDANTGKTVWIDEYPCTYAISYAVGPRVTPAVADGKVYALGAMGDLRCLDAERGNLLWSKNFPRDYGASVPQWGYAAHPLVDGDRVICLVGGKDSVVVAFDRRNGKEVWKALSLKGTELGYCPPMIFEAAGKRQLIIWTPVEVNGLDPVSGTVYWTVKHPAVNAAMTIPTPRKEGNLLFLTSFYSGSMMLKLDQEKPGATLLWRKKGRNEMPENTEALHAVMVTPVFKGDYLYGVCSYGEMRCLEARTGQRVWMDLSATGSREESEDRWKNAFIVAQGDRYFLFNEKGDLIIARMSPKGYKEIDRAHLLEPTSRAGFRGFFRDVLWSHPAFANRCLFARNDKEIVCVTLSADQGP